MKKRQSRVARQINPEGGSTRHPRPLKHEDSSAVWNELAACKSKSQELERELWASEMEWKGMKLRYYIHHHTLQHGHGRGERWSSSSVCPAADYCGQAAGLSAGGTNLWVTVSLNALIREPFRGLIYRSLQRAINCSSLCVHSSCYSVARENSSTGEAWEGDLHLLLLGPGENGWTGETQHLTQEGEQQTISWVQVCEFICVTQQLHHNTKIYARQVWAAYTCMSLICIIYIK